MIEFVQWIPSLVNYEGKKTFLSIYCKIKSVVHKKRKVDRNGMNMYLYLVCILRGTHS